MPGVSSVRYAIGELADLGGVSRRTVRYYVQERLIPTPSGVGRGNHYGREHLDRLLQVKALQEAGRTLDEIRQVLGAKRSSPSTLAKPVDPLPRSVWRRIPLAGGVELHVAGDVRLPSPGRLQELAAWCRLYFGVDSGNEEDNA
jgi:DNA-binding transcriptional MerR regulator